MVEVETFAYCQLHPSTKNGESQRHGHDTGIGGEQLVRARRPSTPRPGGMSRELEGEVPARVLDAEDSSRPAGLAEDGAARRVWPTARPLPHRPARAAMAARLPMLFSVHPCRAAKFPEPPLTTRVAVLRSTSSASQLPRRGSSTSSAGPTPPARRRVPTSSASRSPSRSSSATASSMPSPARRSLPSLCSASSRWTARSAPTRPTPLASWVGDGPERPVLLDMIFEARVSF